MTEAKDQNGHTLTETGHHKKKRRYKATDPDFVAPDGGWGWLVILACGFSNLSTFPMFQQFGLLFREKFEQLEISNAETTTVINMNSAFNACVGLLNGPVFRRFSYRQVAFFGSALVAVSLFLTTWCESFWAYLFFYSACYGSGIGINQSANAIALNTYFKKKRRIATGLSWSTTGLGPIVWPYIITALMGTFGMESTLMLFAAFAGHAIVCSLLLQPVHWHTPFRDEEVPDDENKNNHGKTPANEEQAKPLLTVNNKTNAEEKPKRKSKSLFSSQYLHAEDDRFSNGFDVMGGHDTPMMVKANDGWSSLRSSLAGSRISLTSNKGIKSKATSGQNSLAVSARPSYTNLLDARDKDRDIKRESKKRKEIAVAIAESAGEDCPLEKAPHDLKEEEKTILIKRQESLTDPPNEKYVLKSAAKKLAAYQDQKDKEDIKYEEDLQKKNDQDDNKNLINSKKNVTQIVPSIKVDGGEKKIVEEKKDDEPKKHYTLMQKIVIFFDLGLLKDPMYLNLMLGLTIANFAELNFSILTPFVLKEFNFYPYQIATFMSVLGGLDIVVRLIVPFFAEKIGWENKTFFLIGVLMMAGGRIILVHTQTYPISILVAVIIGAGKGLRTIFLALVIPSYVPLERLPAASGLQLATSGILFLLLGPVVGWVRDAVDNYVVTLHILNITTYMTTVAWLVEPYVTRYYQNKKKRQQKQSEKA